MNKLKFLKKKNSNIMPQFIIYILNFSDHSVPTKAQNIQFQASEQPCILLYDPKTCKSLEIISNLGF